MKEQTNIKMIEVDKIGSATSPLGIHKTVAITAASDSPRAGDVLLGVLGQRRALKGFVGNVPAMIHAGDELHLLNMGGVIGCCTGHHSSLSDAIRVEVLGLVADEAGRVRNIADGALALREHLDATAPL